MLMRKVCTFWLAAMAATVSSHSQTAAGQPEKAPIKVFILAGQSNMEGAGAARSNLDRNNGKGSLEYLVKDPKTVSSRTTSSVWRREISSVRPMIRLHATDFIGTATRKPIF